MVSPAVCALAVERGGLLDDPLEHVMTLLASLIAVGISWSHIRNRISGQIDSDDITSPQQPLV